jgi:hypothetical protein
MAQKVQILLTDDVDGSEAAETLSFAVDGTTYEIDLSEKNAGKFRAAIAPYVGHARKVSGPKRAPRNGSATNDMRAARQWAKDNGIAVPDRGRVPEAVMDQYHAANGAQKKSAH